LDYAEGLAALRRRRGRHGRNRLKRGLDQFSYRPDVIRDAERQVLAPFHIGWSLLKITLAPFGFGATGTTHLSSRFATVVKLSAYAGLGMTPADLAARYREYAANCIAVAQRMTSVAERLSLLDMAQAWITLAKQAEKNPRLAVVYETPDTE
jgi:hypothetical protein